MHASVSHTGPNYSRAHRCVVAVVPMTTPTAPWTEFLPPVFIRNDDKKTKKLAANSTATPKKKDFMDVATALRICAERRGHWVFQKEDTKKKKPLGRLDKDEEFYLEGGNPEMISSTKRGHQELASEKHQLRCKLGVDKRRARQPYWKGVERNPRLKEYA